MPIEPAADGRSARGSPSTGTTPSASRTTTRYHLARVDIGVFANNGVHDSAPAILCGYFPPEEARSYAPGPDGTPRLTGIDYAARPETYADPMLIARADWRDNYHYAADGTLTGWTRTRGTGPDATTEEFTADGAPDPGPGRGRPGRAEVPAYPLDRTPEGGLVVGELSSGRIIDYDAALPPPDAGGTP